MDMLKAVSSAGELKIFKYNTYKRLFQTYSCNKNTM
jgi:hypothetical protein